MLGFMKEANSDIDGCLPDNPICFNPIDPLDPMSTSVFVDNTAVYQQSDPSHSISGTTSQVFAQSNITEDMHGFISSYTSRTGDSSKGPTIMKCFSADHVPAISTLASEFAMFDGTIKHQWLQIIVSEYQLFVCRIFCFCAGPNSGESSICWIRHQQWYGHQ